MPQIPDIAPTMANQQRIGETSIANPLVRDEKYGAKAKKYEKISNILEKVGSEYQQKWERKQAVERQLIGSQEQMNASIAGDKLIQDARNLPDNEVMPFITRGMEKLNSDAYKKYGGDQETWGQVSLNIQKSALETQHNAFNFVQARAKDTRLASYVEQEMYYKSKALTSKDPNIEMQKLDSLLDDLVLVGDMSKEQAAKTSIDTRGDILTGRITQMISNNKLGAAKQALDANRTMLPLTAQIQLDSNIKSTADALQNRAIANQNKIVAQQLKIQEMEYTDPAGAAILKGAKPGDTKAIYIATSNRSILTQPELKHYKARLDAAKTSSDFIDTYNAIYDEKVGKYDNGDPLKADLQEKFNEQMRESVSPTAYTMIELMKSGANDQLKTLFESRKLEDKTLNAIAKSDDVTPKIVNESSLYSKWLLDHRTPDELAAYNETISRVARARMLTTGDGVDEAVKFATIGTADKFNSFRLNGAEVIAPKSASQIHLQAGLQAFVKESVGANLRARPQLDKNEAGYYLVDQEGKRLTDRTPAKKPFYITVDAAAAIGKKHFTITLPKGAMEATNKELEGKPPRKKANPDEGTD